MGSVPNASALLQNPPLRKTFRTTSHGSENISENTNNEFSSINGKIQKVPITREKCLNPTKREMFEINIFPHTDRLKNSPKRKRFKTVSHGHSNSNREKSIEELSKFLHQRNKAIDPLSTEKVSASVQNPQKRKISSDEHNNDSIESKKESPIVSVTTKKAVQSASEEENGDTKSWSYLVEHKSD